MHEVRNNRIQRTARSMFLSERRAAKRVMIGALNMNERPMKPNKTLRTAVKRALRPKQLTPAELIVARFGIGTRELCRRLNLSESAITMWIKRGGNIPSSDTQRAILELAKSERVPLTPSELMYGGES